MILETLLSLVVVVGQVAPDSILIKLIAAEDGRAGTVEALSFLSEQSLSGDSRNRLLAIRALGRLERPELASVIARSLIDSSVAVRIEATRALAQAYHGQPGTDGAMALLARVADESDADAAAELLRALGRFRVETGKPVDRRIDQVLITELESNGALARRAGAVDGLASRWRMAGRMALPTVRTVRALTQAVGTVDLAPVQRRVALGALLQVGEVDSSLISQALRDPDMQLRRLAARGTRTLRTLAGRGPLIQRAIRDSAFQVRWEALQAHSVHLRDTEGCGALVAAITDSSATVQLLALELMATGCGPVDPPVGILDRIASEPLTEEHWQRQVRAVTALAQADSGRAAIRLPGLARSPLWEVRTAAARASGILRNVAVLERLALDSVDNVREAAVRELFKLVERDTDSLLIAQLSRSDYQLILTVAGLLKGTTDSLSALHAAATALTRITLEAKETSRDPRLALIDLIEELGTPSDFLVLLPLLSDFDHRIAERVGEILSRWLARSVQPTPRPLPPREIADLSEIYRDTLVVFEMADGQSFTIRLFPDQAPTNVARLLEMVRDGYWMGRTFHRIAPNFVVQGGSPGANEYAGEARFTRDEIGMRHLRGTVGISTRGRDTGDGQIFVNLMDNPNLDGQYTVIGEVVSGMDLIDSMMESAVIGRVVIRELR